MKGYRSRILTMLFSLTLFLALIPAVAFADDDLPKLPDPTGLTWSARFPHNAVWDPVEPRDQVQGYFTQAKWRNGGLTETTTGGPTYQNSRSYSDFMEEHGEGLYSFCARAVPKDDSGYDSSNLVWSAETQFYVATLQVQTKNAEGTVDDSLTGGSAGFTFSGGTQYYYSGGILVYPENSAMVFETRPEIGYEFEGFTIEVGDGQAAPADLVNENGNLSFTLDKSVTVTATFKASDAKSAVSVDLGSKHSALAATVAAAINAGEESPYNQYGKLTCTVNGSVITVQFPKAGATEYDAYNYIEDAIDEQLDMSRKDEGEILSYMPAVGKKTISQYEGSNELHEESEAAREIALGDTLSLNALWSVPATAASFTVASPLCNTEVAIIPPDPEAGVYISNQAPIPEVTASDGSQLQLARGTMSTAHWFTTKELSSMDVYTTDKWFSGKMTAGSTYNAGFIASPSFGYFVDPDNPPTITVNGAAATLIDLGGRYMVATDVEAVHDPAEPVEEHRVEPTYEADGSYESVIYCKACGAEISRETKTIPKLVHYVTLTIHASSREGDDFADPIVIDNVPKGSTYNQALAIIGKNIGTVYIDPGSDYKYYAAWNLKHSLTTYTSEDEAKNDRFTGDEILNEDTDSYIPYSTLVPAEVTLTAPVCGTNTADTELQFSVPEGAKWYKGTVYQQWWQYSGDIQGGSTYQYYILFDLEWGYFSKTASTAVVNGGQFVRTHMSGDTRYGIIVKVTAVHDPGEPVISGEVPASCTEAGSHHELIKCKACGVTTFDDDVVDDPLGHDWGDWVIVKDATATAEGSKKHTCNRCGVEETDVIPAKGYAPGTDPNQKGTDGTAVGPEASAACAEKAIMSSASDEGPEGTKYAPLALKSTKQGKTNIVLTWTKVKGAKKYVIYGNACGKKNKMKKIATSTGKSYNVKKAGAKLKKGKYYKFIIVALDKNNNVISTSKVVHAATKGGKVKNPTKINVKKAVITNAKKLKKGKTLKLGAKQVGKGVKKHRALSYESSNPKIATVSNKGVVKGKAKGTCYIYVYCQNGVSKKIKVTVK